LKYQPSISVRLPWQNSYDPRMEQHETVVLQNARPTVSKNNGHGINDNQFLTKYTKPLMSLLLKYETSK